MRCCLCRQQRERVAASVHRQQTVDSLRKFNARRKLKVRCCRCCTFPYQLRHCFALYCRVFRVVFASDCSLADSWLVVKVVDFHPADPKVIKRLQCLRFSSGTLPIKRWIWYGGYMQLVSKLVYNIFSEIWHKIEAWRNHSRKCHVIEDDRRRTVFMSWSLDVVWWSNFV